MKFEYTVRPRVSSVFDLDISIYLDHSSAGQDTSSANLTIPYSNFTSGAIVGITSKGRTAFGCNALVSYRADDSESFYLDPNAKVTSIERADFTFQIQPFVTYTFGERRNWQAIGSYQYSSVKSNLDGDDYLDRNSFNQIFTLSLRRFLFN